jgi:hypothetical protein
MALWNMWAGWSGMILGLVSGAVIGLKFHDETFAGGYPSFRRRMLRLAHVAFFALGIINVIFALTLISYEVDLRYPAVASASLALAVYLMPLVCYLSAWRKPFRHGFALPVTLVAIALVLLMQGLVSI